MSIVTPHNPSSTFLDAEDLVHADPSKSTKEFQQFRFSYLPFRDLDSDELLKELWTEDVNRRLKASSPKRGNYVRSYVLSNLRIQTKSRRINGRWNLEALWDIFPVELIITIFEFLHPIDLYHAIRATKRLRSFLLDMHSATIWKESFLNHPDIPFYPSEISAPKWTALIFDPAICDDCSADNTLFDYVFWIRKCKRCMNRGYSDYWGSIDAIRPLIGEIRNQLDDIWSLVLKVRRCNSFLYANEEDYYLHGEPRYSKREVIARAHEMRKYLLDIQSGVTDAHASYQTFLSITRAAIQEHLERANRCETWAKGIYKHSKDAFIASIAPFRIKSKKVLLKQGHDPRDVETVPDTFAKMMLDKSGWANMSNLILGGSKFRKYLLRLETMVQDRRATRLKIEFPERRRTRDQNVENCYRRTITKFLAPDMWFHLPTYQMLYKVTFFADYLDDPQESVGELDVFSAQQRILSFVDTYISTQKRRLLMILLNTGLLPKEATENSNPDDFLGLAIAVFECCGNLVLVGWEDVGIHTQAYNCRNTIVKQGGYVETMNLFEFSNVGYRVLKNLIGLLHLDLRSLLAKDLDALNKRFICKTCACLGGFHLMTWRECLEHAKSLYRDCSVFDVTSEALCPSVLAFEEPFPPPIDVHWACNHSWSCYEGTWPVKRAVAIAHVKTTHGIAEPVEGVDFFYQRRNLYQKRKPLFIRLDKHSDHNYRCIQCPSLKSLRLRVKKIDLFLHMLDKHAIQSKDLVEGVDWIKVKIVEDSAWIKEKGTERGVSA